MEFFWEINKRGGRIFFLWMVEFFKIALLVTFYIFWIIKNYKLQAINALMTYMDRSASGGGIFFKLVTPRLLERWEYGSTGCGVFKERLERFLDKNQLYVRTEILSIGVMGFLSKIIKIFQTFFFIEKYELIALLVEMMPNFLQLPTTCLRYISLGMAPGPFFLIYLLKSICILGCHPEKKYGWFYRKLGCPNMFKLVN